MRRRPATRICVLALVGAVACTSPEPPSGRGGDSGPPTIRYGVVARHAAQFDDELADRRAGTQQEEAATSYLFGHLARAGYGTLLDGVPVANLVRSTNVVAFPPRRDEPSTVVTVAYDTAADRPPSGLALGLFLEAARAWMAAEPDHAAMFVALGAEHAGVQGGRLGSRRLARFLLDRDARPDVVVLEAIEPTGDARLRGFLGAGGEPTPGDTLEVFRAAGFRSASIAGGVRAAGEALLDYLRSAGS